MGDFMYDMHYDLLTNIYFNLIKKTKNKEQIKNDLIKIYKKDNIIGGIINLYFMTNEEMKKELSISINEMKNIKYMFSKSINLLQQLKKENIIPSSTKFLYGIEGCDYVEISDLKYLYDNGLRSVILTWNHKNKYGSGYRTDEGLSILGKKFIKTALELGIIIDVSHANQKTFNDILDTYEKYKTKNSIIIASHSNVKQICNNERNLTDQQLIRLKNVGGYIGLFTNSKFLSNDFERLNYEERKKMFLKHLDYIINNIKFDVNKILISTDDMDFHPDNSYYNRKIFLLENAYKELFEIILNKYNSTVAYKILKENALKLINII